VASSLVPAAVPLSPFAPGSSETLTKMIVDLIDEESMHPKYFARSAVRRILTEASQPGADAKEVVLKYFPDEVSGVLPRSDGLLPQPSTANRVCYVSGMGEDENVATEGDNNDIVSASSNDDLYQGKLA